MFFNVGLEIRREYDTGDLRERRRVATPVLAAIGATGGARDHLPRVQCRRADRPGWGIVIGTDTASALGTLRLVGGRASVRVRNLSADAGDRRRHRGLRRHCRRVHRPRLHAALGLAAGLYAVILMLRRTGVDHVVPYTLAGLGVSLATLASGVHATVAGVAAVGVLGAQGKFWEMHDLLMGNGIALRFEDLLRCASQIGDDVERFEKDLTSRRHALRVLRDTTGADNSGVAGTPTFFINGRRHHGPYDPHSLAAILDVELHSQ